MATHSSILARGIPGTEEPDGLQSTEPQRVRHDWVTNSFTYTLLITAVLGVEGLPLWLSGKESACIAGDLGCIPGLGRSPGEGKGSPLRYSGLENSIDCIVHGAVKSCIRLSDFHLHFGSGNPKCVQTPPELRRGKNYLCLGAGSELLDFLSFLLQCKGGCVCLSWILKNDYIPNRH